MSDDLGGRVYCTYILWIGSVLLCLCHVWTRVCARNNMRWYTKKCSGLDSIFKISWFCACFSRQAALTVVTLSIGPVVPEVGVLLEVLPNTCCSHPGTLHKQHKNEFSSWESSSVSSYQTKPVKIIHYIYFPPQNWKHLHQSRLQTCHPTL